MTDLQSLDPTDPGDPRFDPEGPSGRRVRGGATRSTPSPARAGASPRRLALAAGAVAAIAAAVVLVGPSSSTDDAQAALGRAIENTPRADSGRIVYEWQAPASQMDEGEQRMDIRFSGNDLRYTDRSRVVVDGREEDIAYTYVEVDGVAYIRNDASPSPRFRIEETTYSDVDFPHRLVQQAGSDGLLRLAQRAEDLVVRPGEDGRTVYEASATAGEVFDAAPTAAGRIPTEADERMVPLVITATSDDVIERVAFEDRGSTLEFLDLGEPQTIVAPPTR